MGRDRQYANDAERQRAFRARRDRERDELRAEVKRLRAEVHRLQRSGGGGGAAVPTKLIKVLGMLGSDHAGERDNAAQAATKILRDAGLTWYDVLREEQDDQ